jgi:hypothetical protein
VLEILTILTDIALGALAYKLSKENKQKIEAHEQRLGALEVNSQALFDTVRRLKERL